MDNTTLTIVGMIAAFLTASITPIISNAVKNRFEHKTTLYNLRIALYKELWNNSRILIRFFAKEDEIFRRGVIEFLQQHALRTECYRHALENQVTLFYELKEANIINSLQGNYIGEIMSFSFGDPNSDNAARLKNFAELVNHYQNNFYLAVEHGWLDKVILDTFLPNEDYKIVRDAAISYFNTG